MDANDFLTNTLVEAMEDVVNVLELNGEFGTEEDETKLEKNLVGFIGLTGLLEGSVAVCFNDSSACAMVSKMLDTEVTRDSPDVVDGVGEIANIIAGGAKNRLSQTEYKCDISIPTVIEGKSLTLPNKHEDITRIIKSFTSDEITLNVILNYKINEEQTDENGSDAAAKQKANTFDRLQQLVKETDK